jgi:hypothetical protein
MLDFATIFGGNNGDGAARWVEDESEVKTFDESGVKDFYEIDDWKQCELLIELIELIGSNDVRSIEELSEKEGKPRHEIWANICKARGIEFCTIPERVLMAGRPQAGNRFP